MFDKLTPAHLRLAAYVAAVAFGIWQVVTGAAEADGLAQLVGDVDAQLAIVLAAVGGLAGMNIDKADARPVEVVVDADSVVDAIAPAVVDAIRGTTADTAKHRLEDRVIIQEPADPRELLADMQRRVATIRAGRAAGD